MEALFNEVGTGGVDNTLAMEKAISTVEEMVKTVEHDANSLIGKTLTFVESSCWKTLKYTFIQPSLYYYHLKKKNLHFCQIK